MPAVAALLAGKERETRLLGLTALGGLRPAGPEARDAVARAVALLADDDDEVHGKAVEALGKVGKAAVPALRTALGDPAKQVRLGAARALGEIGPAARDARQVLTLHAQADQDAEVREACARALTRVR